MKTELLSPSEDLIKYALEPNLVKKSCSCLFFLCIDMINADSMQFLKFTKTHQNSDTIK